MNKLYLTIILCFIAITAFGQNGCPLPKKLTASDRKLLLEFWGKFKKAINAENKKELAASFNFPFNCDYCNVTPNRFYATVTKANFNTRYHRLFFDEKLKTTVNNSSILDNLSIGYGTKGNCSYQFSVVSVKPSKDWEGQQNFFEVKKINGKFLIVSIYTIP